jgi:hypothetical protein
MQPWEAAKGDFQRLWRRGKGLLISSRNRRFAKPKELSKLIRSGGCKRRMTKTWNLSKSKMLLSIEHLDKSLFKSLIVNSIMSTP